MVTKSDLLQTIQAYVYVDKSAKPDFCHLCFNAKQLPLVFYFHLFFCPIFFMESLF